MTPPPIGGRFRKRQPLDEAGLYAYAVRALGRRMLTAAELKSRMRQRVEPGDMAEAKMDAVLARLIEHGYLDDAHYAADYTRMRQENERFGRRRVQQELARRGVPGEIIGETLEAAYSDLPEIELARRYVERKRLRRPTSEKESARVVRSMVRAGFSMGTIFSLLKQWRVDEATLSAVESIDLKSEPEPEAD